MVKIIAFIVCLFTVTTAYAQNPPYGQTISTLPQAFTLSGNAVFPIVQNYTTYQATIDQLNSFATSFVLLGTSVSVNNPQRTGEPTTGLYSPATGTVAISSLGSEIAAFSSSGLYLSTPLTVAYGGTGTSSPALVAGTNITITGIWPDNTINASVPASSTIDLGSSPTITNPQVAGDITTGLYSSSPGTISFSSSGTNVGTFSSTGFAGPINLSTITASGTTTVLTAAQQTALTVDAQQFGALQDGTTNDTTAVNAAISAVSTAVGQNGGMGWVRIHGQTEVCGLILKRNVGIDFAGGLLQVSNGCAATYPISSENFSTNSTNVYVCGTNASVPSWFGFRNAKIDCNSSGASYSGACMSFYGPSQIWQGTTLIVNGKNSPTVLTQDSPLTGSHTNQCIEEGHFDDVIIGYSVGRGWDFYGPHDSTLGSFTGAFNGDCSFTSGIGNYLGNIDHAGAFHTYAETNSCGMQFNAPLVADTVMTDGDTVTIGSTNPGPISIGSLYLYNCGFTSSVTPCLSNQSFGTVINNGICIITPGATNTTCVQWGTSGQFYAFNSSLGNFVAYGQAGSGLIGINNYTSGSKFTIGQITGFAGTSSIGMEENGGNNQIAGILSDNKTGLVYAGSGDDLDLKFFTAVGQTDYTGTIPSTDNVRITCAGSGTCHNFNNLSATVGIGSSIPRTSLDDSQNTDAVILPIGTTGQRPSSAVNGMIRYNSTSTAQVEAYINNVWTSLVPSGGGGTVNLGTQYQMGYYATTGTAISGDANIKTDASNDLLIPSGSVGIGTSAPFSGLDNYAFGGGNYYSRDSNAASVLKITSSGGAAFIESATSTSSGNGAPLYFTDMGDSHTWVTIGATGLVGLGITPVNELDVYGGEAVGVGYAGVVTAPTNGMTVIGSVGIGTNTPTNQLSFSGQSAQEIWMERDLTTSGQNFTVQAGGAESGGTNLAGGKLILSSGTSTGTGTSEMDFQVPIGSSASTSDNPPQTLMSFATGGAWTFTGIALPSTSTANGSGGPLIHITSAAGQASSFVSSSAAAAGNGGGITMTGGIGGTLSGHGVFNTASGTGGAFQLSAGAGGPISVAFSGTANAGPGGSFTLSGGSGGAATGASTTNDGGSGGQALFSGGTGGNASGATTNVAGVGGQGGIVAGNGGAAVAGTGGNGGPLVLTAGTGGAASTSGTAGNGGNITLTTGVAGVGSSGASSGSVGTYTLKLGATVKEFVSATGLHSIGSGTTALSTEDVFGNLAVGSYAGTNAAPSNGMIVSGSVGLGTSSPTGPLDVYAAGGGNIYSRDSTSSSVLKITSTGGAAYIESATSTSSGNGAALNFTDMNVSDIWMALGAAGGLIIGSPSGGNEGNGTLNISGDYYANGSAGVNCAAGSVNILTIVVTNGIVTHC